MSKLPAKTRANGPPKRVAVAPISRTSRVTKYKHTTRACVSKSRTKRSAPASQNYQAGDHPEQARDVFRRHFESLFSPLPEAPVGRAAAEEQDGTGEDSDPTTEEETSDRDGSEFGGPSDQDSEHAEEAEPSGVEVVDHSAPEVPQGGIMSKQALRSFMTARPPSPTSSSQAVPTLRAKPSAALPEDSAEFLANDLELRRLLSESHLLLAQETDHPIFSPLPAGTEAGGTAPKLFTSGKARLRATDIRLRLLGAGDSLYARPRAVRPVARAMASAEVAREARRRREAREAGIVLERKGGKAGPRAGMLKRGKKKGGGYKAGAA